MANNIFHNNHKRDFDIYSISTAFEDFQYNTAENACLLLEGKLVGESRQALGDTTNNIPVIPMAHDIVTDTADASPELLTMALESTKSNARQQAPSIGIPPHLLEQALSQMGVDSLPEKIATVFYTVRAQGTPTWILHKADGEVLDTPRFGHYSQEELVDWIDRVVRKES